jgi:hypothetical protein
MFLTHFDNSFPNREDDGIPYVFGSGLCREAHFRMPLYQYWCRKLHQVPNYHRKQWEWVYICQVLYERGSLKPGLNGLGFGVGKEPLVPLFASFDVNILATDLDLTKAKDLGWVQTNQHSDGLRDLNGQGICPDSVFGSRVSFKYVDMNSVPTDLGSFDFIWSSCAFEHLGSIRQGLDFVINSSKLLAPGGVAVHTTEFNITSNERTLDNNPSFVLFRKKDLEILTEELRALGYLVEPIDFEAGSDTLERYVDLPPYVDTPHLRLQLAGEYTSTSAGIVIHAPGVN